jgi:hypothetical protein
MLEHEDTSRFWASVRAGTALPAPNINTNDVFKLRFPFVAYTGVWWDEAMHTAGACEGVVKQFLLQSGLHPSTTHYDFFSRLLQPYLDSRGLRGQVYGGPNAAGAHGNAWMTPVLDSRLNVFEFSSNPSISMQGKLQGTEINLCMRLVHYVVMQGLGVTRDWNASAHENASFVSSVHLRNMSHVSLGCLSLLLHTCVDKALVPVNRCALLSCVVSCFVLLVSDAVRASAVASSTCPCRRPCSTPRAPPRSNTTPGSTSTRTRRPSTAAATTC